MRETGRTRRCPWAGLLRALLLCAAAGAVGAGPSGAQATRALVVVGLGGTAEYRARFGEVARDLHSALTERHGLDPAHVVVLAESVDVAPGIVRDRSTRENVTAALASMASAAGPEDRILVVLVGHGTAQGEQARFNLPGPDLSDQDFAVALSAFPSQTVAFVHTGSAGGGFVPALSGPRRIVLSATRSAREREATEFPRFFAEALAGDGADLDKDGATSLLEAFVYARSEVARHYTEEKRLLTEHALLDDDGDGVGSPDPSARGGDGVLAARFRFQGAATTAAAASGDPVLARLVRERQQIQERIEALRASRASMTQERYDEALEALLVELALKTREIRAREGGVR